MKVTTKDELVQHLRNTADDMLATIKQDDGPPKVKMPSGEYMEGEAAELWFAFHYNMIDFLRLTANKLEELE